jgi:primosomal protein N'
MNAPNTIIDRTSIHNKKLYFKLPLISLSPNQNLKILYQILKIIQGVGNRTNFCDNLSMYVIECLPFSKGLQKESLTYFGPEHLEPGALVKVNLRGKNISALVLESRSVTEAKSEIKTADFQLKKISAVSAKPFLQKEFLEAVNKTAEYFAASSGSILSHLIPSFILENPPKGGLEDFLRPPLRNETKSEISVLQSPDEERFAHYRSLIREEFAKKKSVFLCLPQNEDVRQMRENLERGIESFVCSFHNEMDKKNLRKEWKKACATEHPILVIGTARWLFLPRRDFGTIIIDGENENGWKVLSRPFFDLRFFTETLAQKKNIRIVLGDSFLRTETLYRYKQGEMSEFESVKWRSPSEVKTTIVDLREVSKKAKEFKTLSPELKNLIEETAKKSSHTFIFAARKGLSSVTICRDCGEQVKCGNCGSPVVLYKTKSGNVFKCHQCGETRDASEVCQNCHSWKLMSFGAGLDRVADEIKKEIHGINLFEINSDTATTSAKASAIAKNFYESRGSVLLGTEMALPYLCKKVANSAIASFDSLFSIPDFRIREKIFGLILQMRDIAREKMLIQSHSPEDPTITLAAAGNLVEFYKKEIDDRQPLGYPPFGIFIKITARGTKNFTLKESEKMKNIFKNYDAAVFPSIHEKHGDESALNTVIKLPRNEWPHDKLLSILKSLPPHFEVKVDPDNLL